MKLRRYTKTDIEYIVDSVKKHVDSTPFYSRIPYDYKRVTDLLLSNLNNTLFFCDVVENNKGVIVGGMAAMLVSYVFNAKERYAEDILIFVLPEHRQPRIPYLLLEAYKEWAANRHAREARITMTSELRVEAFSKMVEQADFKEIGRIWRKEL